MNATPTAPNRSVPAPDRKDRGQRTCIGCGRTDVAESMVRLVVSDGGEVAVDIAGGAFGRGAHVHPSPRCISSAPRGLAKSFKRPVTATGSEIATALVRAANRRVHGLLASAARSQYVAIGAQIAGEAFQTGKVHLLVVARDAESGASVGSVMHAVANGGAVAWGTKVELGSLVKKSEVAVLGIASQSLAAAVRSAVTMASCVVERGDDAAKGWKSPTGDSSREEHSNGTERARGDAKATEVR